MDSLGEGAGATRKSPTEMASLAVFHPVAALPYFGRRQISRASLLRLPSAAAPPKLWKATAESGAVSDHDFGDEEAKFLKSVDRRKVDVPMVASLLRGSKMADDVEDSLKGFGHLPLQVYTSVIRQLGKEKQLDAAFAVVEHLKRKSSVGGSAAPNLFVFNSLLSAVKSSGQFERAEDVLADMRSRGIAPDVVTFNSLMSVYLEQGKTQEVLRVFDSIQSCGLTPSPATYSTMLLAYKKTEDTAAALEFFVKLREKYGKGEIANGNCDDWASEFVKLEKLVIRICYMVMRKSLMIEGDSTSKVLKVLLAMDRARVKPDRADYERLVWACTREEHYAIGKELYLRIRECYGDIKLSVCNHLIWLMGKAKKWWAALEIYEDLLDKGPEPNNLSCELIISHFNVLLNAARRRGIWRWGVRLLNKMQDKGLKPGSREWNAVLVACSKAAETSAAVEIFRRMIDQGEKPNILSYGALLSALEKGKLYDEAMRVWDHMCKVGVKPNLHAYTILVSVYIGKGNPEMVDVILREMLSSNIEPTVVTFNAIISGCRKSNMGRAAFEWFHRMKVQNIKPNEVTYQMLIEALVQDGKPRLAYEMYLQARKEGLPLSAKSYDTVMEVCRAYGCSIDLSPLGPRPDEEIKPISIRKNLSEFCRPADLPRRGKLSGRTEIYGTHRLQS